MGRLTVSPQQRDKQSHTAVREASVLAPMDVILQNNIETQPLQSDKLSTLAIN